MTTNPAKDNSQDTNGPAQQAATPGTDENNLNANTADTTDWKKRHDDGRTRINELEAVIKANKDALLESNLAKLPSSEAELEALAKENPKMVDVFARMIGKSSLEQTAEVQKKIDSLAKVTKNLQAAEGLKTVLEAHPDAMTIKASPEFEDWLKTQPADVSEIPYNSNSSPAMIKLLFDNYKQDMNIKTDLRASKAATKQEQIDNSKSVKSGSNVTVSSDNKVYTVAQASAEFKLDNGKTDWKKIRTLASNKQIID